MYRAHLKSDAQLINQQDANIFFIYLVVFEYVVICTEKVK